MRKSEENYMFFYFILLIIVLCVLVFIAIRGAHKIDYFNKAFEKGEISFEATAIPLGQNGTAQIRTLPTYVPAGNKILYTAPRLYSLEGRGCESFKLPQGTTGVYAVSSFYQSNRVYISVPKLDSGQANVCLDLDTKVEILMWAETPEKTE